MEAEPQVYGNYLLQIEGELLLTRGVIEVTKTSAFSRFIDLTIESTSGELYS